MKETAEPFWYRLIVGHISSPNTRIENGLTIPYIIGAKRIIEGSNVDENSVDSLLNEIVNSSTDEVAFIQKCPGIGKIVVALRQREFADKKFKTETSFINSSGQKSLYISKDASFLGKSLSEITDNLKKDYQDAINNEEFSWFGGKWNKFIKDDIKLIEDSIKVKNQG